MMNCRSTIRVIPVCLAYLLVIGLNNKCLEHVSVSGYQITRSLTIMFSIVLSYVFMGQKTSFRACLACLGVVVGFSCGVQGDVDLSLKGALYGVSSSCFVVTYSLVVKRVMGLLDNNEYLLIEYNTSLAIVILAPFAWFAGEFDILKEKRSSKFWITQTVAGITGFIINIAIFLNIKYTTPLTHNLGGTLKACLQTVLAFVFFPDGETMTPLKFIGTVLVIGFSAYYALVRRSEMQNKIEAEHAESKPLITERIVVEEEKGKSESSDGAGQRPERRSI
jgi:GDP-fucose transporter C1